MNDSRLGGGCEHEPKVSCRAEGAAQLCCSREPLVGQGHTARVEIGILSKARGRDSRFRRDMARVPTRVDQDDGIDDPSWSRTTPSITQPTLLGDTQA